MNVPGPDKRHRFGRDRRLRTSLEFAKVFRLRRCVADQVLLVYGHRNGQSVCRLGLQVSRKMGSAVRRNLWKRLIREAFRQSERHVQFGMDLVVIPRPSAVPTWEGVRESLARLTERLDRQLPRS